MNICYHCQTRRCPTQRRICNERNHRLAAARFGGGGALGACGVGVRVASAHAGAYLRAYPSAYADLHSGVHAHRALPRDNAMKTRMAQTLILAAMLATAPLVMAVDCGPMGYHGIKGAIKTERPPIPPIWSADGRLVLYNKDAAMHWISADGTSSKSFPHGEEPTLERVSYGCRGGGECPPPRQT